MQVLYLIGFIVNVIGLTTGSALIRRVALPLCPAALVCLLLSWQARLGWTSSSYANCVVAGLALTVLGDLIMAEPTVDYLAYPAFLCFCMAGIVIGVALSLPSHPSLEVLQRHAGFSLTGRRRSPTRLPSSMLRATRVPLHLPRGIAIYALAAAGLVVWRALDPDDTDGPRFTACVCFVVIFASVIWRAISRIGYLAPLVTVSGLLHARRRRKAQQALFGPEADWLYVGETEEEDEEEDDFGLLPGSSALSNGSGAGGGRYSKGRGAKRAAARLRQQRAERNKRQAASDSAAVENRFWQWCGAIGAVLMTVGFGALGYDRLWMNDDPIRNGYGGSVTVSALTITHTILSWLGQTLLAASVPCTLRPAGSLDDPAVCPAPTDGPPLRVLIVLPGDRQYDVSEVAVPWYILARRGHKVSFATREGRAEIQRTRRPPLPTDMSIHGYGLLASGNAINGDGMTEYGAVRPVGKPSSASSLAPRRGRLGVSSSMGSASDDEADAVCCLCRPFCCCCTSSTSTLACSPHDVGVGVGHPGALVIAMFREMCDDSAFRRPLAWRRPTEDDIRREAAEQARRAKRKAGMGIGSPGGVGSNASSYGRGGAGSGSEQESASSESLASPSVSGASAAGISSGNTAAMSISTSHLYAVPESFDGVIIAGPHPGAGTARSKDFLWTDADLQSLVGECIGAGKPVAAFSSGVALLSRLKDPQTGDPILQDALVTGMSSSAEWLQALLLLFVNCTWAPFCGLLRSRREARPRALDASIAASSTVQEAVVAAQGTTNRFLPGPNPFSWPSIASWLVTGESRLLAAPSPYVDDSQCFVVEDGPLLTAQGRADAFLLSRRFMNKLEEVSTVF